MLKKAADILNNERGQGMAEYGLIIAGVAIAVLVAVFTLGSRLTDKFNFLSNEIEDAEPLD